MKSDLFSFFVASAASAIIDLKPKIRRTPPPPIPMDAVLTGQFLLLTAATATTGVGVIQRQRRPQDPDFRFKT